MKHFIVYCALLVVFLTACRQTITNNDLTNMMKDSIDFTSGYSDVNGIKMYYEIYGQGKPFLLIHGGGSTIQSCFGRVIPALAQHYKVIAVELQNHGRSGFRNVPQTFEQDADDVAEFLKTIHIDKANFFGFSNGGTTALQIAIRHPEIVEKIIIDATACKRDGLLPGFFEGMQHVTLAQMPAELKRAFLKVNPDTAKLQTMFERDRDRMLAFKDITDDQLKSIKASTLIMNGDKDVILPEHAVEIYRLIPNSELLITPGGHGKSIGEITTLSGGNYDPQFVVANIRGFLDMGTTK
jgi:pimeloyl-ACP methyl ester carboxylesterase